MVFLLIMKYRQWVVDVTVQTPSRWTAAKSVSSFRFRVSKPDWKRPVFQLFTRNVKP